ncbi:DUF2325 domain-containing protein [Anaeromyxobacter paludicola]|uniref:DUF2325 domain-containing protein n=1 Tax=Anaeromyxobacter paludicola TaxID=2918171 RepID=A0ABN6NCG4_9BACT|nr:DUF2325 domain-containing protein [Anaeromyxobacter paludicola]BDG10776.1 hypothetical protein AMPC_38890 [Anaeromyxobacter paludicola]
MRIGIVGGLQRAERHLARAAAARGHELEFHDGLVHGRRRAALASLVDRCDAVVVVTDVNSHAAVGLARRWLRARGRAPALLARRCGPDRLLSLLASLDSRERMASAP